MKSFISRPAGFVAAVLFLASFQLPAQTNSTDITPQAVLGVMQRVADWQLANPITLRPTGWICSVGDVGMMALAGISGDPKYRDAMLAKGETNAWLLPQYQGRKYHADDQCYGQVCAELYFLYRDNRMIAPMREHFDWIIANPPPSRGLENNLGQDQWSWCDALFMAPPTWMRLYAATDDTRYMDFAVTNWWRTADYLYDKDEHLFFRDSSFFTKTEANGKKIFWSRGNGWVFAATVRMLQYLPMNSPDRPRFEQLFKDMAAKILSLQKPDGMWRASLLDPDSYPMPEASGSGDVHLRAGVGRESRPARPRGLRAGGAQGVAGAGRLRGCRRQAHARSTGGQRAGEIRGRFNRALRRRHLFARGQRGLSDGGFGKQCILRTSIHPLET